MRGLAGSSALPSTFSPEGPGGGHHDILLSPASAHVGVGIVNPGGRMYFTVDFAP